ncbi:MAG: YtxH domain-containing protein [Gemmatimonadetes bacterium]|nr:YtxH domain-containing protein [Gemmatimonadota bacterium]
MAEQSGSEPTVVVERRSGGGIGLFILGVAVGAGIALLLAPQSGAQTRQDLRRGARRLRRKARVVVDDAREQAEELVRTTSSAARDVARDVAREAREVLESRLAKHGRGASPDADAEDARV